MTLDLTNVARYARICEQLADLHQPICDSGLLDFEQKCFTFGSQKGYGRISIGVEGWDGKQEPFFVKLDYFLNIVRTFPVLELDNFVFKSGEDGIFNIPYSCDTVQMPEFEAPASFSLEFDSLLFFCLKRCGLFTNESGSISLNGIFIKNGRMWGTDALRMCEFGLASSLPDIDVAIPHSVWSLLATGVLGDNFTISGNEKVYFVDGDKIKLSFAVNTSLRSPDIQSPTFTSQYDHATSFTVDITRFCKVLEFICPFVLNTASKVLKIVLKNNNLDLYVTNENTSIYRSIPILEKSPELEGVEFLINAVFLKTTLDLLSGDVVKIQLDPKKHAINITSSAEPDSHIVLVKLSALNAS